MDILIEESTKLNSNKNNVELQKQLKEPLDDLKSIQKNLTILNTLDTNNSSVDLLKVSDTTLKSSSCDDGKYNTWFYIIHFFNKL